MISTKLTTLLGHFNVNIAWGHDVPEFIANLSAENHETLRLEFRSGPAF